MALRRLGGLAGLVGYGGGWWLVDIGVMLKEQYHSGFS
jgi:hypothetical protein